jgi:hypothetical protein
LRSINLTKPTLLRWEAEMSWENPHLVLRSRPADVTAVLRHYKFTPTFQRQIERALAERSYYADSREYEAYHQTLLRNPHLDFRSPTMQLWNGVDQLVEDGFLPVSDHYRNWADACARAVHGKQLRDRSESRVR